MKFASIKPDGLAIVHNDTLIPISGVLPKGATMIDLIAQYDQIKGKLADLAAKGGGTRLDSKLLKPPVERPSKIYAAAGNYKRGTGGLDAARGRGSASTISPEELLENIFLKPPSAIAGPEDNIVIPKDAESIFPELGALRGHRQKSPPSEQSPSHRRRVRLHHHARCHRARLRQEQEYGRHAQRA